MDKCKLINNICIEYADCQKCSYGKNVFVDKEPFRVFYRGNPNANVVLVGEGPGKDEIVAGRPFLGRAGKLLMSILKYAKIPESDVFIINSFVCSDDGLKKPTDDVLIACNSRLIRTIDIVEPKLVVTLGIYALRALRGLDIQPPLHRHLDKVHTHKTSNNVEFHSIAEYHPSYYLRNPSAKKPASVRWDAISKIYKQLISPNKPNDGVL